MERVGWSVAAKLKRRMKGKHILAFGKFRLYGYRKLLYGAILPEDYERPHYLFARSMPRLVDAVNIVHRTLRTAFTMQLSNR